MEWNGWQQKLEHFHKDKCDSRRRRKFLFTALWMDDWYLVRTIGWKLTVILVICEFKPEEGRDQWTLFQQMGFISRNLPNTLQEFCKGFFFFFCKIVVSSSFKPEGENLIYRSRREERLFPWLMSQSVCSALPGDAKSGRARKKRRRGEEEENNSLKIKRQIITARWISKSCLAFLPVFLLVDWFSGDKSKIGQRKFVLWY